MDTMLLIISIVAYCIGSIPSGFLICRLHGIDDIREHGSGNIGATNVARVLGIKYFFIVFLCDFLKAYSFLWLLCVLGYEQQYLIAAAGALLLGNGFPIFLGFRGGKGVATSFGVLSALQPLLLFYGACCWVLVFLVSRIVGLASVVTLLLLPMLSIFMVQDLSWMGLFVFFLSLWGLFLHRANIKSFYCTAFEKQLD